MVTLTATSQVSLLHSLNNVWALCQMKITHQPLLKRVAEDEWQARHGYFQITMAHTHQKSLVNPPKKALWGGRNEIRTFSTDIDHFAKSLRVYAEAQHLSSPRQFLDVPWGFVQWAEIQRSDCRWERVKIIDDIWLIRSLAPFWAMLPFNDCIKLSSNDFVRIGAKSQYRFSFETLGSHILCAARRVSQSYSESMRLVPPIRDRKSVV